MRFSSFQTARSTQFLLSVPITILEHGIPLRAERVT